MKGERLGEFEELVLLSVRLGVHEASGLEIQEGLEQNAGRKVSLGAIYAALDRLTRKGFIDSWLGDPTPIRGGRRKRYYRVTPAGIRTLEETRRIRDGMWEKAAQLALDESTAK